MAITADTPAHTGWGRWPTQQHSPEYVMAEASGLMEYDSRPTNSAQLQRPPLTPPFMVNNSYSMAPMVNLPAPQYQAPNPFGFDSYGPPSPNPVVTAFRQQYQDGLPSLRYSPGESRRPHDPAYPQERQPNCPEAHIHSPPVKTEPRISTPASSVPNTPVDSKIVPPNVDDTGANQTVFFTHVDSLMRAIQIKDEDEKKPAEDRGESYYPSPPHLDHTSIEGDLKLDIKLDIKDEKQAGKPYVCRIKRCGRRFTQKTHLDTHRRTHTGEQPYQCSIAGCGKWFSQHGNLKMHERRHFGEKPFACELCGKRFPQKANLRSHEETHSGIKRFECKLDNCGKKFGQRGNLKNHMNRFHLDTLTAWREKFQIKREEEMSPDELEMYKYFAVLFRNSNKGIKGRGRNRHVKTIAAMASNGAGNMNVPSHPPVQQHHQQQHQHQHQHQHPHQHPHQHNVPIMHLPPPHPTVSHIGGFPPHYGTIPRNDPGHGGMPSRNVHGPYEIYEMGHSSMDGGHTNSGTILEDDRHRGLGFQDRFQERLY